MLHTLYIPTISSSLSPNRNPYKPSPSLPRPPPSPSSHPPLLIRFRTTHRENLRYLKTLKIIPPHYKFFCPQTLTQILSIVNFFKSKGFSDFNIQALVSLCPKLFTSNYNPTDIQPVFDFLTNDLSASPEESCHLILRCPDILFTNVEYSLKPTLIFLKELGIRKLSSPLNAHLLNTRSGKLVVTIRFLEELGFSYEEVKHVCSRFPAIFGYSVENNLRPKFVYLAEEMKRSVEELKTFPQYFAFSLERRIVPRHLHLKERNVQVPLQRMLLWSDQRFYAKWK